MATKRQREQREERFVNARDRAEKQEGGLGPIAVKVPKGVPFFKFTKAGTYRLRILPYRISERDIDHRFGDPGFLSYEYSYWVHPRIGADERAHCCLVECFKKPCPVCEFVATLKDPWGADKETRNALRPKQRQLFALWDLDAKDPAQIQVYETSFYSGPAQMSLGQWIDVLSKKSDRNATFYLPPPHGKHPKYLEVSVEQGKFKNNVTYNIKYVELVDADPLDPDILEVVPALDTFPVEDTYKELKKVFEGGTVGKAPPPNGEAAPRALVRPGGGRLAEEEDEGPSEPEEEEVTAEDLGIARGATVAHEDWGECTVLRVSEDGLLLTLKDEEGHIHKAVSVEDVEVEGEEEEEMGEAPAQAVAKGKVVKPGPKSVKQTFEDDEEEEDLEEDSELEEVDEDEDEDDDD